MSRDIERHLAGYRLRNRSALAAAKHLKQSSKTLPTLVEQREAATTARRVEACAVTQRFFIVTPPGEASRIVFTNMRACRNRIVCPPCARSAAGRQREVLRELIDIAWDIGPADIRAIFLTLTTRSRPLLSELAAMQADHAAGLKRYFEMSRIKTRILGHYTTLELTVGRNRRHEPMAHLHSHSLIAVDGASYFAGLAAGIHHAEWRRLWRDACRLDYLPQVNVKAVRDANGATDAAAVKTAAVELSKYIVAPTHFAHAPDGISADPKVLLAIVRAFKRQRLARFGGIFAEAMKIRRKAKKAAQTPSPDPAE